MVDGIFFLEPLKAYCLHFSHILLNFTVVVYMDKLTVLDLNWEQQLTTDSDPKEQRHFVNTSTVVKFHVKMLLRIFICFTVTKVFSDKRMRSSTTPASRLLCSVFFGDGSETAPVPVVNFWLMFRNWDQTKHSNFVFFKEWAIRIQSVHFIYYG